MSKSNLTENLRNKIKRQFKLSCAYCKTQVKLSGIRMTIDHIIPEVSGGNDDEKNLCLSCWDCNLFKATRMVGFDSATNEEVRLFHPQQQSWNDHFQWSDDSSLILGKSPTGRATIIALKLNRPELVRARKLWTTGGWHPPVQDI